MPETRLLRQVHSEASATAVRGPERGTTRVGSGSSQTTSPRSASTMARPTTARDGRRPPLRPQRAIDLHAAIEDVGQVLFPRPLRLLDSADEAPLLISGQPGRVRESRSTGRARRRWQMWRPSPCRCPLPAAARSQPLGQERSERGCDHHYCVIRSRRRGMTCAMRSSMP